MDVGHNTNIYNITYSKCDSLEFIQNVLYFRGRISTYAPIYSWHFSMYFRPDPKNNCYGDYTHGYKDDCTRYTYYRLVAHERE
jgi:hypothetical protein